MKVAFDSWVLASRFRNFGSYVYARNLVTQFKSMAEGDPTITFCLFSSRQTANDASLIKPDRNFVLSPTNWLDHPLLWRLAGINLSATRSGADIIFSPTSNILPLGSVPVVCTIHDVTPIILPTQSKKITSMMRFFMWSSAKLSRAVITVSQCSKRDLMNIYGLSESKISVIYSGYDEVFFNDVLPDPLSRKNLLARLGIERPYILHHGVIQPRKNLKRLIEAYRLMIHRNPNLDIDLVLAGTVGWQAQDVLEAANSTGRNNGQVILPGALSDAELSLLLKTASLVVMPSLYEGFCLPMVEAMACGTPTIAANTSCLPEVSGGVLKYFDPLSVDDMSACIEQVLDDSSAALALRIKGKERAKHFSWRRCAEETLAVLKAVN